MSHFPHTNDQRKFLKKTVFCMTVFHVIAFVLGTALFLYGMKGMTGSLEKLSGDRLSRTLNRLTSGKMRGMLLGAGVTAVIQSSSAVTVMLVGLVDAGILTLGETVGVIMGANIGTTATAWILSLTGIKGAGVWQMLINPYTIAVVCGVSGVLVRVFSKRKKGAAMVLFGFALLMAGMELMSSALSPLKDLPQTARVFTLFQNPFYGLLAGTAVTAVLQSSSASVGILQALSLTGTVTFASAIPIVMGQNIGTCVTALLSCIGTGKNAKRTAFIHLYLNVIGALLLLAVFYGLDIFLQFPFLQMSVSPEMVALIHTVFNILCTAVLFPFSGLLVRLAKGTVR